MTHKEENPQEQIQKKLKELQRENKKLSREVKELRTITRLQSQLVCCLELEKLSKRIPLLPPR